LLSSISKAWHRLLATALGSKVAPDNHLKGNIVKLIKIFKAGKFIALNGVELTFSENDITNMATVYNRSTSPAQIVIGHPANDKPSYGVVNQIKAHDGILFAELDQLKSAFIDAVKLGRYKKVSAAFYTPADNRNPVKGAYYLKHVGFLGAHAPAVNDLGSVAFSENELVNSDIFSDANILSFACPRGFSVNAAELAKHHKILQYQKALGISYEDAIKFIATH